MGCFMGNLVKNRYLTSDRFLGKITDIENLSDSQASSIHKYFDKILITNYNPNSLGTLKKRFVRTKGSVLLPLFNSKRNDSNSNYVSCVDDLLLDSEFTKEDFEKMYVSSIIKECRYGVSQFAQSEVVASAIANILGVKTAYNTFDPTGKYVISVDFLKDNQELVDFGTFTNCMSFESAFPINNLMLILENGMKNNLPKHVHVFNRYR